MFCYNCDSELTSADVCPNCGADVRKYKKIIYASNRLYNEGLDFARVRNLGSAADVLRQSLAFNKYNIDARNLLGLIYFETGEVAQALAEWVISSNLQDKQNRAVSYIKEVQSDQNRLKAYDTAIRKYNKSLEYCQNGSLDLAVIQLKKVLQYNPKYLRARQLLALLYIEAGEYGRAEKELAYCARQDVGNPTTLRYQAEIQERRLPEEQEQKKPEPEQNSGVVMYRDGNETIIQPANGRSPSLEPAGVSLPMTLLNIGIGLLVGAAVVGFFVLPAQVQKVREDAAAQLKIVSEQSDNKTATISEQKQQIDDLTSKNEDLEDKVKTYKEASDSLTASDELFKAANAYLTDASDLDTIGQCFADIDYDTEQKTASEEYKNLYETLIGIVRPSLVQHYYRTGYQAYEGQDFDTAITDLALAIRYGDKENDESYPASLYYLADSYYLQYRDANEADKSKYADNLTKAQQYFSQVQTDFARTSYASNAETRIQEISLLKNQSEKTDSNSASGSSSGTGRSTAGGTTSAGGN